MLGLQSKKYDNRLEELQMDILPIINVGVIGCGFIAENYHLPAYTGAPGVKVRAVADISENRLKYVSKKFGVEKCYTDYRDLLQNESEINGVSICLPTYLHKDAVIESAAAHKHILCEKPLALTVNDAREMIEAAKKYGVNLYVGFCLRFSKVARMLRKYVCNNLLSKPLKVKAVSRGMKKLKKQSWYFDRTKGGGALFDTGAHLADLLLWTFGDAKVTSSRFMESPNMPNLDVEAIVDLSFTNEIEGVLEVSWKALSVQYYVQVRGLDGVLSANIDGSTLRIQKDNRVLGHFTRGFDIIVDQRPSYHWEEIWEFVNGLRDQARHSNMATGEDGLRSLELIASAYSYS